jgi:hypothetical protein
MALVSRIIVFLSVDAVPENGYAQSSNSIRKALRAKRWSKPANRETSGVLSADE